MASSARPLICGELSRRSPDARVQVCEPTARTKPIGRVQLFPVSRGAPHRRYRGVALRSHSVEFVGPSPFRGGGWSRAPSRVFARELTWGRVEDGRQKRLDSKKIFEIAPQTSVWGFFFGCGRAHGRRSSCRSTDAPTGTRLRPETNGVGDTRAVQPRISACKLPQIR